MRKIYKKSEAFWKHGKHKNITGQLRKEERERVKHPEEFYGSVREAFEKNRKRGG
jgi:hypothetical protein